MNTLRSVLVALMDFPDTRNLDSHLPSSSGLVTISSRSVGALHFILLVVLFCPRAKDLHCPVHTSCSVPLHLKLDSATNSSELGIAPNLFVAGGTSSVTSAGGTVNNSYSISVRWSRKWPKYLSLWLTAADARGSGW